MSPNSLDSTNIIICNSGNFPLCAGEQDCASASTGTEENTLLCPSGTLRKRDGFNNCEFEQCDDPRCELEDYKQCSAPYLHMYRARDPTVGPSGCADWLPCPTDGTPTPMANDPASADAATPGTTSVCPQDVKTCPDGQTLNRNPTDNCKETFFVNICQYNFLSNSSLFLLSFTIGCMNI